MNFIAFDAAYSLYPHATFEHVINLALKSDSYNEQRCLAKYATRGWQTIGNVWPQNDNMANVFSLYNVRFVGDHLCWKMRLDIKRLPRRPRLSPRSEGFTWDPVALNSWTLHTTTSHPWKVAPRFTLVKTPVFRFTYMCADDGVRNALQTFGNQQGLLQWRSVTGRETRLTMPVDWSWYVSHHLSSRRNIYYCRWDCMVPAILDSFH